jgi:hypothetical protein
MRVSIEIDTNNEKDRKALSGLVYGMEDDEDEETNDIFEDSEDEEADEETGIEDASGENEDESTL